MNKKITILSHPNPDVDSFISGYLLEKLLTSKGIDASYLIPDKNFDKESYLICKKYGLDTRTFQNEIPNNSDLFLVDHHRTDFKNKVIGIIDHHPSSENIICDYYVNKEASSTAMMIYNMDPSIFTIDDIKLVILANLVDTNCFHSTKCLDNNEKYKKWSIEMCKKYNFNYEKIYNDSLLLTDLSNLEEAALHGLKNYKYGDSVICSSYIQIKEINESILKQLIDILKNKIIERDLDIWVFVIHDMKIYKTTSYLLMKDNIKITNYDIITSRGTTIMPELEKHLLKKNQS